MLFFRDTYLYFAQDNFSISDDTKLSYRQVPVLFFQDLHRWLKREIDVFSLALLLRVMLIFYFTGATDKQNKT